MTESTLTPAKLWKSLSLSQRERACRAFWMDDQATDDQMQAVFLIAQQRKFRPKSVLALDVDRRARHLASLAGLPDALVARALVVFHLQEQRPMMGAFLDALGIRHEDGLIEDDAVMPDPDKLGPAAASIWASYPHADVSLYLRTLLCQDPTTWGGLTGLPQLTEA